MPPLSRNAKIAIAVVVPVAAFLAYRWYSNYKAAQAANASASTTATDTNAPVPAGSTGASGIGGGILSGPTSGGNAFNGATWVDPATGDTWFEISGAVAGGGTPGSLVGVWVDGTTGATRYGAPPFTQSTPAPPTTPTAPAPPKPTAPPPAQTPAPSNPPLTSTQVGEWPTHIAFGSYSPGEFTQIGSVNGGQYSGKNVSGGVPVYASDGFGGLYQGFSFGSLPNGTTIYIPTQFLSYEAA